MKTHDEMAQEWRRNPAFIREYDDLEQEFVLFDELLRVPARSLMSTAENKPQASSR
jgi:hypothetical protein